MSNLTDHAKNELTTAGLLDTDSDYDGMIGVAVMDLMKVFSSQGHSGFSAALTLSAFTKLARFETLTPITSNPDEWMDIAGASGGHAMWQNKRQPSVFSKDGGTTWYDIDNPENKSK